MSGGSIGNYEWFSMNELATEIEDFANKNEYGYSVGTIYEFVKLLKCYVKLQVELSPLIILWLVTL